MSLDNVKKFEKDFEENEELREKVELRKHMED